MTTPPPGRGSRTYAGINMSGPVEQDSIARRRQRRGVQAESGAAVADNPIVPSGMPFYFPHPA